RKWMPKLKFLGPGFEIPKPAALDLEVGESVIIHPAFCLLTEFWLTARGDLTLTSKRLAFRPGHGGSWFCQSLDIPACNIRAAKWRKQSSLRQVVEVAYGTAWLDIETTSGREWHFRVTEAAEWCAAIE